ncbi:putative membrane protein required for colicin V production [Cytobacillus eiseniae]|uniref:Membrane protein required for colicin V production n=1 Tax=Cytobacillus eiseniae TaxID=762947 RepID=A0ABS4RE93_9BACI|nr:CvpA family protein [Cytobacillus eiseniae]MBP2240660.1 putative membrane protein required for colicin V production [Cytobacillus eiseniae]
MLDLAILIILVFGFFIGLKRGFILQLIHLTGFIIAFIIANMYYEKLAPKLTLWVPYPSFGDSSAFQMLFDQVNLEDAYYRAIAYVVIFIAVKIVLQIIGSMLDFVTNLPILKQLNIWAGGILGFVEVYLIMFILIYIAALVPIEMVQTALNDSFLGKGMIKHTPILSQQIKEMWIEYIAS